MSGYNEIERLCAREESVCECVCEREREREREDLPEVFRRRCSYDNAEALF